MLARLQLGVEQVPQLWTLRFGLPLAKAVAVAKDALFGTGFFFVTSSASHQGIKAKFFNRFEQGDGLVRIAWFIRVGQAHRAAFHRVFHTAHNEFGTQFFGAAVAEIGDLAVVVTSIDHQQRVGNAARCQRLFQRT